MPELSPVQWACLAGAALIAWQSRGNVLPLLKKLLGGFSLGGGSAAIDSRAADEANLAAFKTIRQRLPSDLAKQVWNAIQPVDPSDPPAEVKP